MPTPSPLRRPQGISGCFGRTFAPRPAYWRVLRRLQRRFCTSDRADGGGGGGGQGVTQEEKAPRFPLLSQRRKQDGPAHVSADRTETETSKVSATGTVKVAAAAKRARLDEGDCVLGLIPLSISSILRHISLGPMGGGKIAGYETRAHFMMMRADGRGRGLTGRTSVSLAPRPLSGRHHAPLRRGPMGADTRRGRYRPRLASPCYVASSSVAPWTCVTSRACVPPLTAWQQNRVTHARRVRGALLHPLLTVALV